MKAWRWRLYWFFSAPALAWCDLCGLVFGVRVTRNQLVEKDHA